MGWSSRFQAILLAVAAAAPLRADVGELPPTLRFVNQHTLVWAAEPGAQAYNVYKGIRVVSDTWQYGHDCLALDVVATTLADPFSPARDHLTYYLVTAEDQQGDEGSLGYGPGGVPRPPASPCTDIDGDAVSDGIDNCRAWPNPQQEDFDLDASGNACDDDDDDDGLIDTEEIALGTDPFDNDSDDDGLTDGDEVSVWGTDPRSGDTDADAVADGADNCRRDSNPAQEDGDQDAVGDRCDNCPAIPNSGQESADGDHVGDVCAHRLARFVVDSGGRQSTCASSRIVRLSSGQMAAGAAWSSTGVTLLCGFAPIGER